VLLQARLVWLLLRSENNSGEANYVTGNAELEKKYLLPSPGPAR